MDRKISLIKTDTLGGVPGPGRNRGAKISFTVFA
jgi:hypothetical protein